MENQHPWCRRLLTPLQDKTATGSPVAEDDPRWEAIEAQMIKLGSLSHGQLDLNAVAEQCLSLLEHKSKDMRILAHLLHCLQQQSVPALFCTALALLDCWLGAYWRIAAPDSSLKKQRIMTQIVSRFERGITRVAEKARVAELDHLLQQAQQLNRHWQTLASTEQQELITPLLATLKRLQKPSHTVVAPPRSVNDSYPSDALSTTVHPLAAIPELPDTSDERRWKQTLLNVAQLLCESHPDQGTGYRLRRHALWSGITAAPPARNGKTELAAVSADRINEYRHALEQGDTGVWPQIEHSLSLAPYWFDGHRLSSQAATQQGCMRVAVAISQELTLFLERMPVLKTLTFSDGTPFFPPDCSGWLQSQQPSAGSPDQQDLHDDISACYQHDGLNAALALLNERIQQQNQPRGQFYIRLALAELLDKAGVQYLAQQHYCQLWQEAQRLGLTHWEPDLVQRLQRLIPPHNEQITGR